MEMKRTSRSYLHVWTRRKNSSRAFIGNLLLYENKEPKMSPSHMRRGACKPHSRTKKELKIRWRRIVTSQCTQLRSLATGTFTKITYSLSPPLNIDPFDDNRSWLALFGLCVSCSAAYVLCIKRYGSESPRRIRVNVREWVHMGVRKPDCIHVCYLWRPPGRNFLVRHARYSVRHRYLNTCGVQVITWVITYLRLFSKYLSIWVFSDTYPDTC